MAQKFQNNQYTCIPNQNKNNINTFTIHDNKSNEFSDELINAFRSKLIENHYHLLQNSSLLPNNNFWEKFPNIKIITFATSTLGFTLQPVNYYYYLK